MSQSNYVVLTVKVDYTFTGSDDSYYADAIIQENVEQVLNMTLINSTLSESTMVNGERVRVIDVEPQVISVTSA